jgi:hypothetical protein
MPKYLLGVLLGCSILLKAQDSLMRFEYGSQVISLNSFQKNYNYMPDRPGKEFFNALFFRITKHQNAFRCWAGYSEYTIMYQSPDGVSDAWSGNKTSKDFRIAIGVQRRCLKSSELLYTIIDMGYRNVFEQGHHYGGIFGLNEKFTISSNGIEGFMGFGLKVKILKRITLSPEMGFFNSLSYKNKTTYPVFGPSAHFNYTEYNAQPLFKVQCCVVF